MLLSKTLISFPGLGIGNFEVDNVAFRIGDDFEVYWYGVIITLGIVFAFLYAAFRGKYEGVVLDDLIDIGLLTVVLGVVGARLYYVFTSLDTFLPDPFDFGQFIKNIFNLRSGGLAIYGGIIGGIIGILIVTSIKKINQLKLMDMAAPGVMIGQLMGRWGNFFNGEAHGCVVPESHPLYFMRMGLLPNEDSLTEMFYYHPTFFYESFWNLTGFVIITSLYTKKKFNGQIACMYLSWYGFGRMFIEGLRTDSLYVGSFRISQVVGFVCFVVFGALLVAGLIYSRKFSDENAVLTGFDRYMKPTLEKHPVFLKKNDTQKADKDTVDSEECDTSTGDDKDGENN